ncbi:MAG: hypothetical protein M3Y32_04065 [Pseudomonadota bacterium]|nr:hypothetical protein [Pseudomonadota bacterium]
MGVLAPGGIYIQNAATSAFDRYTIATQTVTPGAALACGPLSAASTLADGTAIGSRANGQIVKFDATTGACQTLFTAPEWIDALAVSPNGTIVGQSHAATAGARQIYRFSISGTVVSKVPLNGVAVLGGIAYSAEGKLYASAFAAPGDGRWYSLFADSGLVVLISGSNQLAASDVCIDSNGFAFGHSGSLVYAYNAATGGLLGSVDTMRDLSGSALACR